MQGITNSCGKWDVSDCEVFGGLSVPFWCSDKDIDGNSDDWSERVTEFSWQACYEQLFCHSICRSSIEPWAAWQGNISCLAVFVVLVDRRKLSFDYSTKQKLSRKRIMWLALSAKGWQAWYESKPGCCSSSVQRTPSGNTFHWYTSSVSQNRLVSFLHFSVEVTVMERCEAT